jgi:hypothetical protein
MEISRQDMLAGYETEEFHDFEIMSVALTRSPSTLAIAVEYRPTDPKYLFTFEEVSGVFGQDFYIQNVISVVRVVTGASADGEQWKPRIMKLLTHSPEKIAHQRFSALLNEECVFVEIQSVIGLEVACICERFRIGTTRLGTPST